MKPADTQKPRVMIVDDATYTLQALPGIIATEGFKPLWVADAHQALTMLRKGADDVGIIVIDLKTSGMGGGGFLHQVRYIAPRVAVLIVGPLGPFLYQKGRFYELRGQSLKKNINTILGSIAHQMNLETGAEMAPDTTKPRRSRFGVIIGKSKSINAIYGLIESLKNSVVTVLIQGESGTGKELVARTVHQTSQRHNKPFVGLNCGAIPPNLVESELFGHERGAFTSATRQRKGKFEIAQGGTLLLDEIGELGQDLQVKLLRVLQEKEFQRVGGNRTIRTDIRIIAASSRDLKQAVKSGFFRQDLFYRLNVMPIDIPPLRDRPADIPLLLDHFFAKTAREAQRSQPLITESAFKALCAYPYPGNVRELINVVERISITSQDGKVSLEDLPAELQRAVNTNAHGHSVLKELPHDGVSLQEVEKELIRKTLDLTNGNKTVAAKILGITRRRLYLRLSQYELMPA